MYRWTLLHHWWAWLQALTKHTPDYVQLWRCSEKRVGTFSQRAETDERWLFILSFFITRPASFPPLNQRVEADRERQSSVSAGVGFLFNVVCSQKKKTQGNVFVWAFCYKCLWEDKTHHLHVRQMQKHFLLFLFKTVQDFTIQWCCHGSSISHVLPGHFAQ